MSVQIPARQSRFIFYQVTADHMPAWVVLYASFWSRLTRGASCRDGCFVGALPCGCMSSQ